METKAGSALELDNSSGSGSSTQNLKPDQGKRTNQNNGSTDIMERTVICQDENRIDPSREYEDTSYSMQPQAEKLRPNEHTFDKGDNAYQGSPCSSTEILYCTVPSLGYLLKKEERRLQDRYSSVNIHFEDPKDRSTVSFKEKPSEERNFKPDYGGQKCQIPTRHYEQTNDTSRSQPGPPDPNRCQIDYDHQQQSSCRQWPLLSNNFARLILVPAQEIKEDLQKHGNADVTSAV